jgi:hypothetical protein
MSWAEWNHGVLGIRAGFFDRAEQWAEAIRQGRVARTIRPSRLHSVLNHIS